MDIIRKKKDDKFIYLKNRKIIKDKKVLDRIKSLVIPPAWINVCIANNKDDKIQCIGVDSKNRKQYKYNLDYIQSQSKNKYNNLIYFGKKINTIRNEIYNNIRKRQWDLLKTISFIILILDKCHLRIGNEKYKDENESYGITTLEKRHIVIKSSSVYFDFIGKKGVENSCVFKDKKIISLFKSMYKEFKHKPNDTFFKYYNSKNGISNITSSHINDFLKQYGNFSAKNFRTWTANEFIIMYILDESKKYSEDDLNTLSERKCNILLNSGIDLVSQELNNTRAICKKSYICNDIFDDFKNNRYNFIKELKHFSKSKIKNCTSIESILLKLLKKYNN